VGVSDGKGPPPLFALCFRGESSPGGVDADERLLRAGDQANQIARRVVDLDDASRVRFYVVMKTPTAGKLELG
jgi:hypothetical protein